MNAELIAALELDDSLAGALERVIKCAEVLAGQHESEHFQACLADDINAIRAHITDLQNGGERARVVAWLRVQSGERPGMFQSRNLARTIAAKEFADAIKAGAHMGDDDVAADT